MAALVKKKGSPARKGPRGLPSFADDSASSKGVSRGDSSGTRGSSSSGNTSGVGGGGGGGGGASGSRGSSTGGVGAGNGSNAPGNGGGGQRGPGGPSGPNSAASGTRGIGGPSSPMGGQGSSFSSPQAAAYNNRAVTTGRGTGMRGPLGPSGEPTRPGQGYTSAAPPGMVGTPRGYVNREALNRVDTAMKPAQAIGEQLPYFTPGVGPLLGATMRVAAPVVGAVAAPIARGLSGVFGPAARSVAEAERVAEAMKAVQAYNAAAVSAGAKPMYTESQIGRIMSRGDTLATARARAAAQPGAIQRGIERIDRGIDATTSGMGVGTGDLARAKASGAIAGYGTTLNEGYKSYQDRTGNSRRTAPESNGKTDREGGKTDREGGKPDFGGYRRGGAVRPRRTFKNK